MMCCCLPKSYCFNYIYQLSHVNARVYIPGDVAFQTAFTRCVCVFKHWWGHAFQVCYSTKRPTLWPLNIVLNIDVVGSIGAVYKQWFLRCLFSYYQAMIVNSENKTIKRQTAYIVLWVFIFFILAPTLLQ